MFKIDRRYYLSQAETSWMKTQENSIEHGLTAFYKAGYSLDKIRDNRLYRDKYKMFEDYCRKRWGMSRVYAGRLIRASRVIDNLKTKDGEFDDYLFPMGNKNPNRPQLPTCESQARPLAKLPKNLQKQAWQMVVENVGEKEVTAKDVSRAVDIVKNQEIKMKS